MNEFFSQSATMPIWVLLLFVVVVLYLVGAKK